MNSPLGTLLREGPKGYLRGRWLKTSLLAGDLVALLLGTIVGHYLSGYANISTHGNRAAVVGVTAVLGMWAIRSQGLLVARNVMMRVVEITRIARACVLLGFALLLTDRIFDIRLHIKEAALACGSAFVFLVVWRSIYRAWLMDARANGRYLRRTILIGTGDDVARLAALMTTHPDLGMDLLGIIGPVEDVAPANTRWLGDQDKAEEIVHQLGATGVVISPAGIAPARFNTLIRNLQGAGVNVFIDTGLSGIEARRLRTTALAHEPLLWVQAPKLNRLQALAKRTFDIVVATTAVLVLSPVLGVVAVMVKAGDGGPVFFSQPRVGRYGKVFRVIKFRTMHVDAEARLAELTATNERTGPLFKMKTDPRVTRVGHWLRESSLDELPQLFNVIKGEMSLVGPRPALPREVAQFTGDVRGRELVMPGITGLWQVEARDNPSFDAYRRLDLFYVENWTVFLDVLILAATVEHVLVRIVKSFTRRS